MHKEKSATRKIESSNTELSSRTVQQKAVLRKSLASITFFLTPVFVISFKRRRKRLQSFARERENQESKSKWKRVQKESHNSVTDNKNSRGQQTS